MKLLLLAFAALGFLVTPASGGGTSCSRQPSGHCKLQCHPLERSVFMCDRYKQCCVKNGFIPQPILPPPVHRAKNPCRKYGKSKKKQQGTSTTSQPLPSPMLQRTISYT